mmetsp:Transcript_38982/g.103601  ORF Transcript_38982/g.103601 Transcript_38982/m.103601 type:complete len:268 (-) Transcript_38982:2334-3137(-)
MGFICGDGESAPQICRTWHDVENRLIYCTNEMRTWRSCNVIRPRDRKLRTSGVDVAVLVYQDVSSTNGLQTSMCLTFTVIEIHPTIAMRTEGRDVSVTSHPHVTQGQSQRCDGFPTFNVTSHQRTLRTEGAHLPRVITVAHVTERRGKRMVGPAQVVSVSRSSHLRGGGVHEAPIFPRRLRPNQFTPCSSEPLTLLQALFLSLWCVAFVQVVQLHTSCMSTAIRICTIALGEIGRNASSVVDCCQVVMQMHTRRRVKLIHCASHHHL